MKILSFWRGDWRWDRFINPPHDVPAHHLVLFFPSGAEQQWWDGHAADESSLWRSAGRSAGHRSGMITQRTRPRSTAGPYVWFVSQTLLSDGESSSEADQDNSAAPLLAFFCDSSPHRSTSPRRPPSPPQGSSSSPLPDTALSALRSAVRNKALQLQVTCRFTSQLRNRRLRGLRLQPWIFYMCKKDL